MYHLFVSCVPLQILLWQIAHCQGKIHTELRITKAINCDMEGLRWIMRNISLYYQYQKTYMNAQFDIIEDVKAFSKIYLHIERCNEQGYDCEDFQNWRIDRFCQMMTWKNQVWSEFLDHIHPSIRCPVKKGSYELRNATMDVEAVMMWYPQMTKYRWKAVCKIVNEKDLVVYCGYFEVYLHQYYIRDSLGRKPSKKPKNDR